VRRIAICLAVPRGSLKPRWSYPIRGGERRACDECHQVIEARDRERLLKRSLLIPVPRTLPDRYAPRFRERAPAVASREKQKSPLGRRQPMALLHDRRAIGSLGDAGSFTPSPRSRAAKAGEFRLGCS
jgi:hypothetical protein